MERQISYIEHNFEPVSQNTISPPPPYEETQRPSDMSRRPTRQTSGSSERHRDGRPREASRNPGQLPTKSTSDSVGRPSNPAILLMGITGAGKSSFIASATGFPVGVGHTLESHTFNPQGWKFTRSNGTAITLIDTPGFNDTKRSDTDLLYSIITFILREKYQITNVIYMHPITERKLTGSTMKNLRVLRALCGEHYFQNIVLVTSMWTVAPVEEMDEQVGREVQFNSAAEFWGDIIDKGATYCRWDDTRAIVPSKSAAEIVEMRENRNEAPKLGVLLEVEKGIKIESTQAYQVLTEELRKKQERERRAARMNEEEMNQLRSQKENLEVIAGKEEEDFRRELDDLKRIEGATQGGFGSSSREGGRFTFRNPFTSLARPHRRFSEGAALPRPSDSRQYQETGERDGTRGESIQTRSGWDNMRDGRVSRNERERNYESGPERPERRRGGRRSRGSEYKLVLVKRKR